MKTLTILSLAATLAGTTAFAADMRTSGINTHPATGGVNAVDGAMARMVDVDGGVFVDFDTNGLTPGHVHTMWFVTIANPAACATAPCSGKDVLTNAAAIQADVGYASGAIASPDGNATFAYFQADGELINPWFGAGMTDGATSEIHLVIQSHGPIIQGREEAMLTSFRDGCADESITAPYPATALVDGEPGPNTCGLVQFSIFTPADASS